MIYGNKFLATTNESMVKVDPLMSFSILESSVTELDNIFNFCFNENTIIYEASIKEIFSNLLEKVKGAIVKILGWIRTAIEFVTGKVIDFIQKLVNHLSKNEAALTEAENGKEKKYYYYDLNKDALKTKDGHYVDSIINIYVKSMGEELIQDFEEAESDYRNHNKYVSSGFKGDDDYLDKHYNEYLKRIEEAISVLNEANEKDILEKTEFDSNFDKMLINYFNEDVAKLRATDRTVKEFESKFKHIENVNKKINSIVTSDSSEYKRDLQTYINGLYGYSAKYISLVPKAVTKYLGILNKATKYNVKTIIQIAISQGFDKDKLADFKKSANEFVEGKEEPGTYLKLD